LFGIFCRFFREKSAATKKGGTVPEEIKNPPCTFLFQKRFFFLNFGA
jgi:hypothetical protein